ncbi:hypothetical protein [Motilibacter aurantiacus]|uniref:hypothetical protein n=1 Tax=Motilibacter aurantiacus TaxID=2714955 RepID=UPI00140965B4|nr:hypothetical protein [Motilibacter aurantiacus]NHC47288.1 hypothetical protein [Motilibacter aurantiacus]
MISAARRDKDRELARQLAALRRPTAGAWMVNALARWRPDDLEDLLALGPALQEAAATLSAEGLRALSTQRNRVLAALVARASRLAAEAGLRVDSTAEAEAQDTLAAALAEPAAAERVRTGTLAHGLRHSGFGPAPEELSASDPSGWGAAPNYPNAAAEKSRKIARKAGAKDPGTEAEKRREDARKAAEAKRAAQVARAEQALSAAQESLTEREQAAADAAAAADELAAELDRAREQVRDLERRSAAAALDGRAAESAAREARTAVGRAQRALDRARAAQD